MARAIWKGSISFGLVNIPVTLHAAEIRPDIQLHMLDSRNHSRVRYERVNQETGEEVPWDSIVRGYEYDEGKYVLLSEEEIEKVRAEVTKTVEIEDFVDAKKIDPIYFDKPYFLVPDKKQRVALKSYALLRETLRKTGKVGIAQVVIRTREYLCAVLVRENILMMNLLRFAQELRDTSEYELPDEDLEALKISSKELAMATQLVEAMSSPWKPENYEDHYRSALMEWIEKKVEEGRFEVSPQVEAEEPETPRGKVVNLMDYLKKSVEEAQSRTPVAKKTGSPRKKSTAGKKRTTRKKTAKKSARRKAG